MKGKHSKSYLSKNILIHSFLSTFISSTTNAQTSIHYLQYTTTISADIGHKRSCTPLDRSPAYIRVDTVRSLCDQMRKKLTDEKDYYTWARLRGVEGSPRICRPLAERRMLTYFATVR